MTPWTVLAAGLAEELTTLRKLRSSQCHAAVRAVPRHELVSVHHTLDPHNGEWTTHRTDLAQTYSNTALFVLPGGLYSISMPGLMTRMLESLDVHDGHRVLQVGAGTGYIAVLLSHRLDDTHVFAVDLDPTLVASDGANGLPQPAPYDRIIATCSVPAVPWPCEEQASDGGLILVDVKPGRLAGNVVLLRRDGDHARPVRPRPRQLNGHPTRGSDALRDDEPGER